MADLSITEASQTVRLVGNDEANFVNVKSNSELKASDTCDTSGVNTTLNLTTSAVEGFVSGSRLTNRKFFEMQALTTNVKWGYDSSCPFNLFKSQFFSLPIGNIPIYFKASTGTAQVAIAEKS